MRLKYYLRGLGLGIIFAVIIMMIGFHDNKQSMSDTEIIEKAKTLGMVEAKNISGTVADEYNSEKTDSSATNSGRYTAGSNAAGSGCKAGDCRATGCCYNIHNFSNKSGYMSHHCRKA